ncbi:MAG: hypothetical protein GX483_02445 [Actinomycetaceae bacterium]|nr:hypothetical protein [Actinomycetaceae bacterium]
MAQKVGPHAGAIAGRFIHTNHQYNDDPQLLLGYCREYVWPELAVAYASQVEKMEDDARATMALHQPGTAEYAASEYTMTWLRRLEVDVADVLGQSKVALRLIENEEHVRIGELVPRLIVAGRETDTQKVVERAVENADVVYRDGDADRLRMAYPFQVVTDIPRVEE